MSFEQAAQYLAKVIPWDGTSWVNIHSTFKPKDHVAGKPFPWGGRACKTLKDAISALEFATKQGSDTKDIYVCLSTQSEAKEKVSAKGFKYFIPERSSKGAIALKSLFIDIDAKGVDKNSYANIGEAVAALGDFLKAVNLPKPSIVVASGGGLHVYWTMMRALSVADWTPMAFALAEATKAHGLKCDTQCTVDAARVLRVPDTKNYKTDPPKSVRIAGTPTDFDYANERLEKALAPYKRALPAVIAASIVPFVDPLLFPQKAPIKEIEIAAGVDLSKSIPIALDDIAPECAFIRDTITSGGKDNGNSLWNLTTLLATFTEGGRADSHRMGQGHRGYTLESTDDLYDRKVKEQKEKNLGWPTCSTISGYGVKACDTCQHFNKNKTPFHFAVRPTPAVVLAGVAAGGVGTAANSDLPAGYSRDPSGIVNLKVVSPEGETNYVPISEYTMTDPWLQVDPRILHFTSIVDNKRPTPISIENECINGMGMRGSLQAQGFMLPVGKNAHDNLGRFLVGWIKKLQESKDSVASSAFGWNVRDAKLDGFVYGGRIWSPGGDQAAANPDPVIARQYRPSGELQPWVDAARMVTSQGRQDLAAIIAASFAAPLIRFTGEAGAIMSAYSTQSGIGKSTSMTIAQAVWADPIKAKQSLSDTQNSVMGKLGWLRSLPMFWDELKTEEDTKKFVNITFQVTAGKEKSRMTKNITQREPGSWQTLLVSASNDSLLDFVVNNVSTTTAGLYRVFEFAVAPFDPKKQLDTSVAARMVAKLNDNYGQVGLAYAKFLGANFVQVEEDFAAYIKALGREVKTTSDERFWIALIASVCVGASYANQLGFTSFDLVALKEFMLSVLARSRAHRVASTVDMSKDISLSTIFSSFMKAQSGRHVLYTNRIWIGKGAPPPKTSPMAIKVIGDRTRLQGVHVHIGVDDKLMRISSTVFSEWCKEKGFSRHIVIEALKKELHFKEVKARLGSGCGADLVQSVEYLLEIDLAGTPYLNIIDEA